MEDAIRLYHSLLGNRAYVRSVCEGAVFLVSDDRELPSDSRNFGTVPLASCSDRILFRFWGKDGWGDEAARFSVIK